MHDWAWAAGVFEGEGSFVLGKHSLYVQIEMTDLDVVRRFAEITSLNVETGRLRHKDRKMSWKARCGNTQIVVNCIKSMWPWLGERRRARALELAASNPDKYREILNLE